MTRNNFRKILLFQVALEILLIFVSLSEFSLGVPESIRQAEALYDEAKMDEKSKADLLIMFCLLVVVLTAMIGKLIGLYFFKRWGIWLSLVTFMLVEPILNYYVQYQIYNWVSATLNYWTALGYGFIISVALLTSIKQEFK